MNTDEKNATINTAKATMNIAIGLVTAEVFGGLVLAPRLLRAAAELIRATGDEQDAVQAEQRATECAPILIIPWPFIYIGSTTWIAAVARLRDLLPRFVDLQPAFRDGGAEAGPREAVSEERDARALAVRAQWDKLTDAQRSVLVGAGISADALRSL